MPTLRKFGKHVSIWQQRTGPVMHCALSNPLAPENLFENTDAVLRPRPPRGWLEHPIVVLSRGGSLLPSIYHCASPFLTSFQFTALICASFFVLVSEQDSGQMELERRDRQPFDAYGSGQPVFGHPIRYSTNDILVARRPLPLQCI